MENASKALIMASTVLLGMMIIAIGVALFNSFSSFSSETVQKMTDKQIDEFNSRYLKYYGTVTYINTSTNKETQKPIEVTAHDIITLANHAKQNNRTYELESLSSYDENTYYIQVQVGNVYNFEKKDDNYYHTFLSQNSLTGDNETKYYICKDVKISSVTKRVVYIKFEDYK